MASEVAGRLVLEVNVGGNDTVKVTPANDHTKHKGTLEGALGVVDDPREGVGDVLHGAVDVALVEVLGGAALLVGDEAALNTNALLGGEETGVLGPVENHPPAEDADENRGQALDDEDPSPAGLTTNTVHLGDGGGKETAEGAGQGGGREEDGGADADLRALVPAGQVFLWVHAWRTREESSFSDAKEPTSSEQTGKVGAQAHERHDGTPDNNDASEEDSGCEALEKGVGGGLEDGIADKEDCEREVVVGALHVEVLLHAGETGIANVGSVEEREEVL
ncbi:hypothetical protein ColTof4_08779 [Colletotrichum tofieldiae]|nr:hypothetical protein ColTof4_08779 [Colletotrichum tofieldiae]